MRSIGLDVGKRFAEVAISEPGRGTRSGGRISASAECLRAFAATLGPDDQVVLEATTNTWPIVELLEGHAGRVVVSNPLRTRAIADAKTKTDTIDAATLAELLAADYLPTVWQPDPETRALRRRVAGRAALVAERTRLRNRISAVLMRNLVGCPWSDPFGRNGRSWLTTVELPVDEHELVDRTLRLLDGLAGRDQPRRGRDRRDSRRRSAGPAAPLDPGRRAPDGDRPGRRHRRHRALPPAEQARQLSGLDPIVRQSGGRPAYTGHISHAGQGHVRGLLVEAALGAARVPGPLHAFYGRVAGRRGHAIAIVAVARKLAVLAWHLLTHDVDYRWAPARLTATKIRAVELAAGAPSRRGRVPGSGDARGWRSSSARWSERSSPRRRPPMSPSSRLVRRRTRSPPNGERLG